eukprot:328479-Pleurochrysis_carterae.AAC.2
MGANAQARERASAQRRRRANVHVRLRSYPPPRSGSLDVGAAAMSAAALRLCAAPPRDAQRARRAHEAKVGRSLERHRLLLQNANARAALCRSRLRCPALAARD